MKQFVLFSITLSFLCLSPAWAEDIQGLVLPFKTVTVSSPVDDIIEEVLVSEGDVVKAGDPLAKLVSSLEVLDVDRTARLVEKATFAYNAANSLLSDRMVSKEAAMEKQVDLQLATIQHQATEVRLKQKTITSPISGIVVKKYKEAGEAATRVDKLFDVVNVDQVYVQFYLDPLLLPKLQPGTAVNVRFPLLPSSGSFEAKIAFIDPRMDAGSGLCRVKLLIDNSDHAIKSGMRGEANFTSLAKAETAPFR